MSSNSRQPTMKDAPMSDPRSGALQHAFHNPYGRQTPFNRRAPAFKEPHRIVTFFIGPKETKFTIHRELVYLYSPALKAAFESPFIEGLTQEYRLVDTTEEAFLYIMQFFYGRRINFATHCDNVDWKTVNKSGEAYKKHLVSCRNEVGVLTELWLLGDKFDIPRVQNLVIEHIYEISRSCICGMLDVINYVYENTLDESPLRYFIVYHLTWNLGTAYWNKDFKDMYPAEFLIDMVHSYSSLFTDPSVCIYARGAGRKPKKEISEFFVTEPEPVPVEGPDPGLWEPSVQVQEEEALMHF